VSVEMRCPRCHNDLRSDSDFCPSCDAYLPWEPADVADPPTDHPTTETRVDTRATAVIPGHAPAAVVVAEGDALRAGVEVSPGETLPLHVTVRNQSAIVDSFYLGLTGVEAPSGHVSLGATAEVDGGPQDLTLGKLAVRAVDGSVPAVGLDDSRAAQRSSKPTQLTFPDSGWLQIGDLEPCRYSEWSKPEPDSTTGTFTLDRPPAERVDSGTKVALDEWHSHSHGWWELAQPQPMRLVPFGIGPPSACEGSATLLIHPPRVWTTTAGTWYLRVDVLRGDSRERATQFDFKLTIRRFDDIRLSVDPLREGGLRRARFELSVRNAGNAPAGLRVGGFDQDNEARVMVRPTAPARHRPRPSGLVSPLPPDPPRTVRQDRSFKPTLDLKLDAGAGRTVDVLATPVTPQLVQPIDHRIVLEAARGELELPTPPEPSWTELINPLAERRAAKAAKAAKRAAAQADAMAKALGQAGQPADVASSTAAGPEPTDAARAQTECTYHQKALTPKWAWVALAALAALVAIIIVVLMVSARPKVKVPNVLDQYATEARTTLDGAGFDAKLTYLLVPASWTGHPHACRGRAAVRPGEIVALYRRDVKVATSETVAKAGEIKPGSKIKAGSHIYMDAAVLPGEHEVPDVNDLGFVAAQSAMSCSGFALGHITPTAPVPKDQVVVGQLPAAGEKWKPTEKSIRLLFSEVATVPNLTGQSAEAARIALAKVGLGLGSADAPPGSEDLVAHQSVAPGELLEVGKTVGVTQGTLVPQLRASRLPEAEKQLSAHKLKVIVKPPSPPATDIVIRQVPKAGSLVLTQSSVTLTFHAPPKKKKAAKKGKGAGKKGSTGTGVKAHSTSVVPSLTGDSAGQAQAQLARVGLRARELVAISARTPAGRLLSAYPAARTTVRPGATVTLTISAGSPPVAVDNGRRVLVLSSVSGRVLLRIGSRAGPATEPSWSPDGSALAYVSDGSIMTTRATGRAAPRRLTAVGGFSLPTFPDLAAAPPVIAAIRQTSDDGSQLCLVTVAHPATTCTDVPGFMLGGEISWSPSGMTLLVGASTASPTRWTGLLEFTSRRAFATRARDWQLEDVFTPQIGAPGATAAAYAPDGRQIAVATDPGNIAAIALDTPADPGADGPVTFALPAPPCAVQWRADSRALLVQTSISDDCTSVGPLYRMDAGQPGVLSLLARSVAHPSWQPLRGFG
jgi:beta-lactam-binding protein with PASTA domain